MQNFQCFSNVRPNPPKKSLESQCHDDIEYIGRRPSCDRARWRGSAVNPILESGKAIIEIWFASRPEANISTQTGFEVLDGGAPFMEPI